MSGITSALPAQTYNAHLYIDKELWITVELPFTSTGGYQKEYITPWLHPNRCFVESITNPNANPAPIKHLVFRLNMEDVPGQVLYQLDKVRI